VHSQLDNGTHSAADTCPVSRFTGVGALELSTVAVRIVCSSETEGPQHSIAIDVRGIEKYELTF